MKTAKRSSNGMSLIEMLAAIFIMSFVAAAICEIAMTQNYVAFRSYNRAESIIEAQRFESELKKEIHMARFIGDQYGALTPVVNNASYIFPSPSNPNYPSYNGFPWSAPYTLSPQTLVVQVPKFQSGVPTASSPTSTWNVDTYVYQVVADSHKPNKGQFILQKAVFSGGAIGQPQTIVNGIVGPIDPGDAVDPVAGTPKPRVFSFFSRQSALYTQQYAFKTFPPLGSAVDSTDVNGVSINMEIFNNNESSNTTMTPFTVPVHVEYYTRSNAVSSP